MSIIDHVIDYVIFLQAGDLSDAGSLPLALGGAAAVATLGAVLVNTDPAKRCAHTVRSR